jgi:hypothetical protein
MEEKDVINDGREYSDIYRYRAMLDGKYIVSVALNSLSDEGLIMRLNDGSILSFGFKKDQGYFDVLEKPKTP